MHPIKPPQIAPSTGVQIRNISQQTVAFLNYSDLFRDAVKNFVHLHTCRVPIVSEADNQDSVLLRQDGLVDLPAVVEMWQHVRHVDPKLLIPKLQINTFYYNSSKCVIYYKLHPIKPLRLFVLVITGSKPAANGAVWVEVSEEKSGRRNSEPCMKRSEQNSETLT